MFPKVLVNYQTQGEGHGSLIFRWSGQEAQVTIWSWHLEAGGQGTAPWD